MSNTVSTKISDAQLNKTITIESNGNPTIKAKTSSATGFGQFLSQTWLQMLKQHGPREIADRIVRRGARYVVPDGGELSILNLRRATTPALKKLNIDMLARFLEGNAKIMGPGFTDGDLYLSHFLGAGAAKKMLRADPDATAVSVAGKKAAEANISIFYVVRGGVRERAKTAGELRRWAQNAMDTRWDKIGRTDWIAKFYVKSATVPTMPLPKPRPDELTSEDDPELSTKMPEALAHEESGDDTPPPDMEISADSRGDPAVYYVQRELKEMNYNPGGMDGRWGGMTRGAIAEFLNDRKSDLDVPSDLQTFREMWSELSAEIKQARSGEFVRPVSDERANAGIKKVEEIAPEAAQVGANKQIGFWGTISAGLMAVWSTVKSAVLDTWSFFMDHEDSIPDSVKDPSTLQWAWDKFSDWLPVILFVGLAGAGIYIYRNSRKAIAKITGDVQSGLRK